MPERCLHQVPDTLPFEMACLTEPHCVAYNAMCVNSTIQPGRHRRRARARADRPAVRAHGGAVRRASAHRGRPGRPTRGGCAVARELGATHTVNVQAEDLDEVVRALTPMGADVVCDASGASQPLELRV